MYAMIQPPLPPTLPVTRRSDYACEARGQVGGGLLEGRIVVTPRNVVERHSFSWTPGEQPAGVGFTLVHAGEGERPLSKTLVVNFSVPEQGAKRPMKHPRAKLSSAAGSLVSDVPAPASAPSEQTLVAMFKVAGSDPTGRVKVELLDDHGGVVLSGAIDAAQLKFPQQVSQPNPLTAFPAAAWKCTPKGLK